MTPALAAEAKAAAAKQVKAERARARAAAKAASRADGSQEPILTKAFLRERHVFLNEVEPHIAEQATMIVESSLNLCDIDIILTKDPTSAKSSETWL